MEDSTIKIVGAGPAGLSAAIHLARKKNKVTVYERNSDVGMRFNNDFQGLENWSTEEDVINLFQTMSINVDFFHKAFYRGFLYGPSVNAEIESEKPFFYLVKRGTDRDSLDHSLKEEAIDLGVRIIFNSNLNEQDGDIIATGPRKARIFAIGMTFGTNLKDIAIIILDDRIAPKGYAYLLVNDGKATLATVIFEKVKDHDKYLENAIRKFKEIADFDMSTSKKFFGFGSFLMPESAVEKNKLYVGEAAGFQDFLFGFGIRYAVRSGYLAAKSIINNEDYDKLWKKDFNHQLKTSLSNRRIYSSFGDFGYDYLIKQTRDSVDPRKFWNRLYNQSLSRKIFHPIALYN